MATWRLGCLTACGTQRPTREGIPYPVRSFVEDLTATPFGTTYGRVTARVLDESRRVYGAQIDELVLRYWVDAAVGSLLTERTRITTFVPLLAMRDIRAQAERYIGGMPPEGPHVGIPRANRGADAA
jgi:hypothetical protein